MLACPLRKAAVEHGDRVVAEPAHHPPEAAGKHSVVLIVGDDLDAGPDPEPASEGLERLSVWQGMPSVRSRSWSREIAIEVRVYRARHVSGQILPLAPTHIVEPEAAVHHCEAW